MAKYVYGIVEGSADPPTGAGIAGAPLELIANDGTAALVSDVAGDEIQLGRVELLDHSRVLEEALSRGTVLPMRFGVVMEGPDEVRARLLEGHGEDLRRQLESLAGKIELSLRATYEEGALMREVLLENASIAELSEAIKHRPDDATYYDRIRLGEMVAEAIERKRETDAREIVDALAPLALDIEIGELAHERVVLSVSFLVERSRLSEFDEAVERLGHDRAGRIRIKYIGPLPPHSFVELDGGV